MSLILLIDCKLFASETIQPVIIVINNISFMSYLKSIWIYKCFKYISSTYIMEIVEIFKENLL